MYNLSIITATHMSYNYYPCVKGRSINNIRKYLLIFRATLITVCCLCSYICTVVLEAGSRVCTYHSENCTYSYTVLFFTFYLFIYFLSKYDIPIHILDDMKSITLPAARLYIHLKPPPPPRHGRVHMQLNSKVLRSNLVDV